MVENIRLCGPLSTCSYLSVKNDDFYWAEVGSGKFFFENFLLSKMERI